MDIERAENFLPVINLTEEMEKITLMKTALRAYILDHERILRSVHEKLKAGRLVTDRCIQESKLIHHKLNKIESEILETHVINQAKEAEALKTLKENKNIKRKIIALKNDIEQQGKIIRRANETIDAVTKNYMLTDKKIRLPDVAD